MVCYVDSQTPDFVKNRKFFMLVNEAINSIDRRDKSIVFSTSVCKVKLDNGLLIKKFSWAIFCIVCKKKIIAHKAQDRTGQYIVLSTWSRSMSFNMIDFSFLQNSYYIPF